MHRIRTTSVAVKVCARRLRVEETEAEAALWEMVRDRRLGGVKFRRQHAFKRFILDFYAPTHHLAIEVDGAVHRGTAEHDAERTALLSHARVRVLRFTNTQVLTEQAAVTAAILTALAQCDTPAVMPEDASVPPR